MSQPEDIQIRPTEREDAREVFRLLQQFVVSYTPDRNAFDTNFPRLLGSEDAILLIACLQGNVVGYILAFRLLTLFANGPVVEIQELMVDPQHRKQGFGGRLVEAVVEHAWKTDCVEVTVPTRRAGAFYVRHGFAETAAYFKLKRDA